MHIDATSVCDGLIATLEFQTPEVGNRRSALIPPASIACEVEGFSVDWAFGLPTHVQIALNDATSKKFKVQAIRCRNSNLLLDTPDGPTGLYLQTEIKTYTAHDAPSVWERQVKHGLSPVDTAMRMQRQAHDDFNAMVTWLSNKPDVVVMIPNVGAKSELQPYSAQELFNTLKEQNS